MAESTPKIQLNSLDGSLWYMNRIEKLSTDELAEVKTLCGEYWWTDNDELVMLTIFWDGDFSCERRKKTWSYRNGTYSTTVYKFLSPTKQEVEDLGNKLLAKFDQLRIRRLQQETDRVSGILSEQFNALISSFKGLRTRMLIDTDWTQLADSPISDEDKELYKKFRQYLRDMTEDPAWLSNDVFQVDFPITPKVYLQKDPNRETEYLSIPAHFENQGALKAKINLARVYEHLGLPGLYVSNEDWENTTYEDLTAKLNKYLAKINADLEFKVQFKFKDADRPADYGEISGQSYDKSIDDINSIT